MMRGHLGQYVIVQPDDDLIIVRLGQKAAKNLKTMCLVQTFTNTLIQRIPF